MRKLRSVVKIFIQSLTVNELAKGSKILARFSSSDPFFDSIFMQLITFDVGEII